jgi:hypothetical protein
VLVLEAGAPDHHEALSLQRGFELRLDLGAGHAESSLEVIDALIRLEESPQVGWKRLQAGPLIGRGWNLQMLKTARV